MTKYTIKRGFSQITFLLLPLILFANAIQMVYNISMIKLEISANEGNQRLDRFLKKYYRNAPLSYIYKLLRTGVKVNGKRVEQNTRLVAGDQLTIEISEEEEKAYLVREKPRTKMRQFQIAYEDENLLVVEKPFGLLTHGTMEEGRETLANQVLGYLTDSGAYDPKQEKTFVPSPVNRLDRNTTGLVIFGKNAETLRSLSRMLRERGYIRKYYLTLVHGEMREAMILLGRMEKDRGTNKVKIRDKDAASGKSMETRAKPIKTSKGFTLVEVELITGRTHQIRAQLATAGYPVVGDRKYGDQKLNEKMLRDHSLKAQFLHASRLVFENCLPPLEYMSGKELQCQLPPQLKSIETGLFT